MGLFPASVEYALTGVPRGPASKVYVVDYVNGSDSNPGTKWNAPLKTVEAAYAKCTTLKNDVVLLVPNGTANLAVAAITWAKHYTHLIGLGGIDTIEPRSIIQCPAALATTPFVTWSAYGCVVKDVQFMHSTTDVLGLVNVHITGGYNTFSGCHFSGGLGANALTGCRHLKITGGAGAGNNYFKRCWIGQDTVALPDGAAGVEFLGAAHHNTFDDCTFVVNTAGTTYVHVLVAAAADVGILNQWKKCNFYNFGAGIQAEAFKIGAALGATKRLFLIDSWLYGATEWETTNNGLVTNVEIAANFTGVATGNILKITS